LSGNEEEDAVRACGWARTGRAPALKTYRGEICLAMAGVARRSSMFGLGIVVLAECEKLKRKSKAL
jgi:hypothetical protein